MSSRTPLRAAVAVAATLATGVPALAAPTLIGDTISFMRAYPNASTQYGPAIPSTTVAAGTSDVVAWGGPGITIDPEADSIRFNFSASSNFIGNGVTFDGFVVSGIDAEITALSILSNTTSFTPVSLVNTVHGFTINFGNRSTGSVVVGLQLHNTTPVPEPTSLLLAAFGLPVVLLGRRRAAPRLRV